MRTILVLPNSRHCLYIYIREFLDLLFVKPWEAVMFPLVGIEAHQVIHALDNISVIYTRY